MPVQQQGEQAGRRVYLDYAATAPLDPRLHQVIAACSWANANSLYAEGREARRQLEDARKRIARAVGARQPAEIVFTIVGTEGDNMAVRGLLPANAKPQETHVIVSSIEHHAVADAAASLKRLGCKVHAVPANRSGVVTPQALQETAAKALAQGGTLALVAVMAVNNELGTIQPVRALAAAAHELGALFFTDCVQALGKVEVNLEESGVDAAAFSAHKLGALKGAGFVYLRRGTRVQPLLFGGGQESGLRSGTSNVMGACAMAAAVEYAVAEREAVWQHAAALRAQLLEGLGRLEARHGLAPTLAVDAPCVPHTLSLLADGLEGETLVQRLDSLGVAASSGSACSTGSLDPSPVLTAIGIPKQRAYGSLRLSFGAATTAADIDHLLAVLPQALR